MVYFFFECQLIKDMFTYIMNPVLDHLPCIMVYKGLWLISLHMHFPQTPAFSQIQAGSKFTGNHFNQCMFTKAFQHFSTHATDPKIHWNMLKWLPIQLVSVLTSLAPNKAIKGAHVKSKTFATQSWALMMLFPCRRCSVDFFGLLWSLFDVFDTIEQNHWLFDVVFVIIIEHGDQWILCKEHDICSSILGNDVAAWLWKL